MGYSDLHSSWQFLVDWTSIMAQKYGSTVYDREDTTKSWDWGQALMREMYGINWMKSPSFDSLNDIPPEEPCSKEVLQKAKDWEAGDWPEWAWTVKYTNCKEEK